MLAAGQKPNTESRRALAHLCGIYWYPLYAFVRRQGHDANDAMDLTQGFFTRLLERNDIASADQQRGRFRSWLLASLKHYLANEWHRANAQKRGGGMKVLSFDLNPEDAESRYKLEPSTDITAEKIFDRRWALTLLDQVLGRLEAEMKQEGKGDVFDAFKPFLTAEGTEATYQQIAKKLSSTEGAVKVAVHRLRRRYRDLLKAEIAHTVEAEEQIEQEIDHLLASLSL